ncbi:hypothetical protein [Xanthomonas sacchari]|uniref:hypothetical protein n=1 Tax=Xanthomonas sacchari TaxID=56458 RepID=UPI00111045E6|nr:hypothetical protein [Xanthomonas sacchari]MDV0437196.1 hypothetical protein [Xanthomonas sacchari]
MKKIIGNFIGFGFFYSFMVASGVAIAKDEGAEDAKICSIIYSKDKFNDRRVRVNAYALTDMHMTMLYDNASGAKGVALFVPKKMRKNPDVVELVGSSFGPEAFDGSYRVWATFTGRVVIKRGERPEILFILEDISGLEKRSK